MPRDVYSSQLKIVMRLLPSTMTLEELIDLISSHGYSNNKDYSVLYYVQGSILSLPYSRCYLELTSVASITPFIKSLDRISIQGSTQRISVSTALCPLMFGQQELPQANTLETDPDYLKFLEDEKNNYIEQEGEEEKQFKPISIPDEEYDVELVKTSRENFMNLIRGEMPEEKKKRKKQEKQKQKKNKRKGKNADLPPSQPKGKNPDLPPSQPKEKNPDLPPSHPKGKTSDLPPSQPKGKTSDLPPSQPKGRGRGKTTKSKGPASATPSTAPKQNNERGSAFAKPQSETPAKPKLIKPVVPRITPSEQQTVSSSWDTRPVPSPSQFTDNSRRLNPVTPTPMNSQWSSHSSQIPNYQQQQPSRNVIQPQVIRPQVIPVNRQPLYGRPQVIPNQQTQSSQMW